ncbi:MAG: folylpolyglutamate synthase/dihydrofolate synthase family protein [Fimbriimonadaceae bacterium]
MSDALDSVLARLEATAGRKWRLGTDRMAVLLEKMGLEGNLGGESGTRYIHVAGTNGKGSTVRFVECILESQGFRTGATYSPYVYEVTERIHLGGVPCGRDEMARWIGAAMAAAEGMEGGDFGAPTEFEIKTAAAFLAWKEARADWVALEVGLGGRLDASNVVDPACSVIVSIGLDHTEYLGETLEAIALEKAGIVKPGRPVVVGDLLPEALTAVRAVAADVGAPVWEWERDVMVEPSGEDWCAKWPGGSAGPFVPGIQGGAMAHNAALALAACSAAGALHNPAAACTALGAATLPGRMERRTWRGRALLLDGAHNAEAARVLAASLSGTVDAVVGMLEGHDAVQFAAALSKSVREVITVPIQWHRSRDPIELAREFTAAGLNAAPCATLEKGLTMLEESDATTLLVTGSFYLLGEVARAG